MLQSILMRDISDHYRRSPMQALSSFLAAFTGRVQTSRRIARLFICSIISILLSGCILALPSEAVSPFSGAAIVSPSDLPVTTDTDQVHESPRTVPEQCSDFTLTSLAELNGADDDSTSDGKERRSSFVASGIALENPHHTVLSQSSVTENKSSVPIWSITRGHQLQVYESSVPMSANTIRSFVKPPRKLGGGLFYSRSQTRRSAFLSRQSRTVKVPKQFASGAASQRFNWITSKKLSHFYIAQFAVTAYSGRLWLLNRTLLL